MTADGGTSAAGFSWTNLLILLVVAAVAWPLWQRMRTRLSNDRKRRWAEQEGNRPYFTPENDPDLRRDPPSEQSGGQSGGH